MKSLTRTRAPPAVQPSKPFTFSAHARVSPCVSLPPLKLPLSSKTAFGTRLHLAVNIGSIGTAPDLASFKAEQLTAVVLQPRIKKQLSAQEETNSFKLQAKGSLRLLSQQDWCSAKQQRGESRQPQRHPKNAGSPQWRDDHVGTTFGRRMSGSLQCLDSWPW